jgi:hypothetical protein
MGVILHVRGFACQVAGVCPRDSPVEGEVMAPQMKVLPDYVGTGNGEDFNFEARIFEKKNHDLVL